MPPPWFEDLAAVEDPGPEELQRFVWQVREFLHFVLNQEEFGFLWEDDLDLRALAIETFERDVFEAAGSLVNAITETSHQRLRSHGLLGRPLRFKFRVLASVSSLWDRMKGSLTVRGWFKQICEAIDAVLDSLIHAVGAGGIFKEFKDALSALAKTTER